MYISVRVFCVHPYGPLPPGGQPVTVNKYRIVRGGWSYPRDKEVHDLYYITQWKRE